MAPCDCCVTWKAVDCPVPLPGAFASGGQQRLAAVCKHVGFGGGGGIGAGGGPGGGAAPALRAAPAAASDGGVLINTVLGEVSTTALGWTSSHEHIFTNDAKSVIISKAYPETFPREYIVASAVEALRRFKAAGGGAMVDCTTVDLGRDIALMAEVSEKSGVHIIATTGCWIDVPLLWRRTDVDALAALYIRDCTVGIEGTAIKAGIIKCAHQVRIMAFNCLPLLELTYVLWPTRQASPGKRASASLPQGRPRSVPARAPTSRRGCRLQPTPRLRSALASHKWSCLRRKAWT